MAGPQDVKLDPYLRKGEHLIAEMWDSRGLNVTASDYHTARNGIMTMRARDPAAGDLYDKYLGEVVGRKGEWPAEKMDKLQTSLAKNNLGVGPLLNDVGRDLRAHGYSASYRPVLAIDVNGRPMHPEVVANNLRSMGVEPEGSLPRSAAPGKVEAGGGLVLKAEEATKFADTVAEKAASRSFSQSGSMLTQEIVTHARKFGVIGKLIGGAVAGTLAMVSGANASEVGQESINAVAPGLGTLTMGEGPKQGVLCEAFGQATGAVAGIGAGLGVGALTSFTGPGAVIAGGAVGIATEAAATPAATWACNQVVNKMGL